MGESSYRVAIIAIILCLVTAGFITLITSTPQHDDPVKQSKTVSQPNPLPPNQTQANSSPTITNRIRVLWYDDIGKTYTFRDYSNPKGTSPDTWTDIDLPIPENGTPQKKAAMVRFLEWDGSMEKMTGTKYLIDQETITTILNNYILTAPPPALPTQDARQTPSIQPTPDITPAPGMLIPISNKPCNLGDGTIRASFGYVNRHNTPVTMTVGDSNYFSPGVQDRGQPTLFQPGIHQDAFTVLLPENGTSIAWHLMNTTVGAGQVPPVQAGFTAEPLSGYAPLDVKFMDQSTGGTTEDPLTGTWNFGDKTTSPGVSVFHRYELPGTYKISRDVLTSCGRVSATKTITVYEVAFMTEPLVEKLYTVKFTDKSTGEPTAWAWDFNDGFSSWEQNPVHTWKSPGTYDVGLTISGKTGSGSTVRRITIQ